MLKNLWYGLAVLIFLSTFVWTINRKITGAVNILGMTFFTFIGYMALAAFVVLAIILIIKWVIKNF